MHIAAAGGPYVICFTCVCIYTYINLYIIYVYMHTYIYVCPCTLLLLVDYMSHVICVYMFHVMKHVHTAPAGGLHMKHV